MPDTDPNDPFRRLNYRRLIAWSDRIEREWPFLEHVLQAAPQQSVIDLGSGTGEHCRFLAEKGVRAVGIDRSASQIESAREFQGERGELGPEFLEGEIADLPGLTEERFGAAISLGNVLPYLEDDDLRASLRALASRLLPGARFAAQLLNYHRIREQKIRHLPVNIRPAPEADGEIVWLRIMTPAEDGHILFHPTTLLVTPGAEEPVTIHKTREILLRAWTWPELEAVLGECGFGAAELFGSMDRDPFDPDASHDLIFVAQRA